ncbi:N-acetylglucosamine-6-phosphate deacetylase [Kurthia huakuii]|nr:hypothetical protein [Kurthia huakuii]MBM7698703.1 N-acetylglucosamine-6-phosphate deacetylase [Kurthia huakuii]
MNNGVHLPNGALTVSVLTMDEAVRNMRKSTNYSLEKLVRITQPSNFR